jgi:hypothetical protein
MIDACPLNFPETCFYQEGVAVEVIKTDFSSGRLVSIKQENRLTAEQIRNHFVSVVRERRKAVNRVKLAKEGISEQDQ